MALQANDPSFSTLLCSHFYLITKIQHLLKCHYKNFSSVSFIKRESVQTNYWFTVTSCGITKNRISFRFVTSLFHRDLICFTVKFKKKHSSKPKSRGCSTEEPALENTSRLKSECEPYVNIRKIIRKKDK